MVNFLRQKHPKSENCFNVDGRFLPLDGFARPRSPGASLIRFNVDGRFLPLDGTESTIEFNWLTVLQCGRQVPAVRWIEITRGMEFCAGASMWTAGSCR